MNSLSCAIAWRYIKAAKKQTLVSLIAWFSFLGILLGVATLIIVMSVMNGFRHELMERILGFNGHLTVFAQEGHFLREKDYSSLPSGSKASVFLDKQIMILGPNGTASGCIARAICPQDIQYRPLILKNLVEGNIVSFSKGEGVLLGYELAAKLKVKPGDFVRLMVPEGQTTAIGTLPLGRYFKVSALFDSGMSLYDQGFLFMPLKEAQDLFEEHKVSSIEIFTQHPETLGSLKNFLKEKINDPKVSLYDWKKSNIHFFKALEIQSHVMFLILSLIVLVAVFNVISCLTLLVKDKTRDIAILRTFGARRFFIMKIFFSTGAFLGVTGTLGGALLGLGFSYNIDTLRRFLESFSGASFFEGEIYFLSSLPSRVDPLEVTWIVGTSLGFSFLATLYPSWKASNLQPAEALRYS